MEKFRFFFIKLDRQFYHYATIYHVKCVPLNAPLRLFVTKCIPWSRLIKGNHYLQRNIQNRKQPHKSFKIAPFTPFNVSLNPTIRHFLTLGDDDDDYGGENWYPILLLCVQLTCMIGVETSGLARSISSPRRVNFRSCPSRTAHHPYNTSSFISRTAWLSQIMCINWITWKLKVHLVAAELAQQLDP